MGHPPLAPTLPNKRDAGGGRSGPSSSGCGRTCSTFYGLHIGQMLLTRADLEDRERYLNAA